MALVPGLHGCGLKRKKRSCVETEGNSDLTLIGTDCLDEASSLISSLREENARLKAGLNMIFRRLALVFVQVTCSYVIDRPCSDVRYMTLQLLERHVHDEGVYKGTPVAERWKKVCDLFGWKESWDTDEEIPPVVQYADDKADEAMSPYGIDLNDVRERLKETRDQLKQLPSNDCACILLNNLTLIIDNPLA